MAFVPFTLFATSPVEELRKAILVVYYGTSEDEPRASALDATTERVRKAFPQYEVRDAFTQKSAIAVLKRRTGIVKPTVAEAMAQLRKDGYNSIIVGNCEMIEGNDTKTLEGKLDRMTDDFYMIKCTKPLLYTLDDCRQVIDIVLKHADVQEDEQAVLIGHGRDGAANDVYCLVDYILQHEGHTNCHVGTISGYPSLENIKEILRQTGSRKVVLVPLIIANAGHATKDIYKTWRASLEEEGYEVRLVRKAVCDYPEAQQLIVDKIKETDEDPEK